MTTTTLTDYESTYAVGRQQVHFNVRSSTPTTGAMNDRDAQGQWRVERGGTIIHKRNGILDFGWLGLDGDVVHARAVDRAGNAGSWSTYTFSVAANTAADEVRYVDNTASGGAAGTSGDPFQTVAEAKSYMESNLGSGEVGVIFIREGQTHSLTASAWSGGDSTARLVRFVRWGTSSTKPVMQWNGLSTGFSFGKRGSIHVESIVLNGGTTPHSSSCVDSGRSGGVAADRNSYNGMFFDVDFEDWGYTFEGEDDLGDSDRFGGALDFYAWDQCTLSGNENTFGNHYYWIGLRQLRYGLMRDVEIVDAISGGQPIRVYSWADSVFDVFVDNSGTSGMRMRLNCQPESDTTGWIRCSFYGIERNTTSGEFTDISLESDAGSTGNAQWTDCRFINCKLTAGGFGIKVDDGGGDNAAELTRVDFINCVTSQHYIIGVSSGAGTVHTSIRWRDCAVVRAYQDGGFLNLQGTSSSYAADAIDVSGCYVYFRQTGGQEGGGFYMCGGISEAQLAAIVDESDYNHTGKVNSGAVNWVEHSGGTSSLATWQSASGVDGNSAHHSTTTFDLTNNGSTPVSLDVRLTSGSGDLGGAGYALPLGVAVDADGYLRDTSTPDAGPYEYGASTLPDDPVLSGSPYTLSVDTAAIEWTANDVGLTVQRRLSVDTGAIEWTANAVGLAVDRQLAVDTAAVAWTANAVGLAVGRQLAVDTGAIAWTANAVTLSYSEITAFELSVDTAAIEWTANDVGLAVARRLDVDTAQVEWTANTVGLTWSGAPEPEAQLGTGLFIGLRIGI